MNIDDQSQMDISMYTFLCIINDSSKSIGGLKHVGAKPHV